MSLLYAENDMREIIRLAGGRMKDLTLEIYTSSRFGGLSRKELAKIYGLTAVFSAGETGFTSL